MRNLIKTEYQKLQQELELAEAARFKKDMEYERVSNSTCPRCRSKDVIHKSRRIKGEIHGKGSGRWGLFGSGYYNSSIDGEIDTEPVNNCNKCGHQWNILDVDFTSDNDILEDELHHFYHYFDTKSITFDPHNPAEEFNSLEDKIKDHQKQHWQEKSWLRNFSPETIRWAVRNHSFDYDWYKEIATWPDEKFYEWGWPKPPTPVPVHREYKQDNTALWIVIIGVLILIAAIFS